MTEPTPPAPAPTTTQMRQQITIRLMRLSCARNGGCSRRCRRQKRCVKADEAEREYSQQSSA